MRADVTGVRVDMRHSGFLPEADLAPPVVLLADAGRDPDFQAHPGGIASGPADHRVHLVEGLQRLVAARIGKRHDTVTEFGRPPEARLATADEHDLPPA